MISGLIGICIFAVLGAVAAQGSPGDSCPRHRGLPEGFPRGNNTIRDRALYRIDLRHALKGYEPNDVYKFRVHTTARKVKFNDATVVVDALNPKCGTGKLLVQDDTLYSPQGCPDVVTTQQKEPMGRAHFRWQAPSCGCVHIRVRVHANSLYYLEDEEIHNGALARTMCPKDIFAKLKKTAKTAENSKPNEMPQESRMERLEKLCDVNQKTETDDLLKNEAFVGGRHITIENEFELDRLHIALAQRKASTLQCCKMKILSECQTDWILMRRRVTRRLIWIHTVCKGEDRYTCFNYTLYCEATPQDQRAMPEGVLDSDLDDFDPANDVDDFPAPKLPKSKTGRRRTEEKTPQENKDIGDIAESDEDAEDENDEDEEVNKLKNPSTKHTHKDGAVVDTEVEDTGDIDAIGEDTSEEEQERTEVQSDNEQVADDKEDITTSSAIETSSVNPTVESLGEDTDDVETDADDIDDEESKERSTDIDPSRTVTDDECCMNGITAGTIVATKGWDACFAIADKFNKLFDNWNKRCDRRFVMCCMRVIDGETLTTKVVQNLHNLNSAKSLETTTVVHAIVSVICANFNELTNKHACKREIKKLHIIDKVYRRIKKNRHKNGIKLSMPRSSSSMSQNKATKSDRYLKIKDKGMTVNAKYYKQRSANEISESSEKGKPKTHTSQRVENPILHSQHSKGITRQTVFSSNCTM